MKYVELKIICFIVLLCSCTKSYLQNGDNSLNEGVCNVIGWNVSSDALSDISGSNTRALVEDYYNLRDACTQLETHAAEKIGLFGKSVSDGRSTVVFNNTDLWWWEKVDGNPFNDFLGNSSFWNYDGENVFWTVGAEYVFKAYFPKSKVELQPGSGADKLLAVYDTQVSQYDFLVAHRKLHSQEENPVNLKMQHALAALKFDFQFVDKDVKDELLAFWLENGRDNGFYTSSTLNYVGDIVWPESTSNPVGAQLYYWEPFIPLAITGTSAVNAYSTSAPVGKGSIYTDNQGWLLVIPQSSEFAGTLKLCFRTSMGGNVVYKVDLPAYDFQAGYRYNYHVKMTSTEIKVGLTVAQWNERKSSYEIDFN